MLDQIRKDIRRRGEKSGEAALLVGVTNELRGSRVRQAPLESRRKGEVIGSNHR